MPYGPRYGRMDEPATEEELAAERRKERKVELVADAIKNLQLSWEIKTRFGEDTWNIMSCDLQWREGMPGSIIIVDRDTDMDVKIYAPGTWFGLRTMAFVNGEWGTWEPHAAYLSDLADRLMNEEVEQDEDLPGCEYDWCSKPLGHMPPHARKDGKRILNDGPQA